MPSLNSTGKLYAVFVMAPKQEAAATAHCFGDCGHISMGMMMNTDYGPAMVCAYDNCPHKDEDTEEPVGKSEQTGQDVWFRILKNEEAECAA